MAALMTVIGVGELSALNAVAGAFAEYVPVIHIVAKPSLQAQENKLCVHHTLGDGDFTAFEEMSRKVSCLTVNIDNAQTAPFLIDEAIRTCWVQSRPVSVFIPCDMVRVPIARHVLNSQPVLDRTMPRDDMLQHGRLVDAVVNEVRQATNPVVLVGGYGILHGAKRELDEFLRRLELPVLAAASGLGMVDASLPHFSGLYVGSCASPSVLELMKSVDLVLCIGNIQSDLSTSGFSGVVDDTRLIEIQRTKAKVKGQTFEGVHANSVLSTLTSKLGENVLPTKVSPTKSTFCVDISHQRESLTSVDTNTDEQSCTTAQMTKFRPGYQLLTFFQNCVSFLNLWPKPSRTAAHAAEKQRLITHDWLWVNLGKWLIEGDIILTETGTSSFGIWNTAFPPNSIFVAQYLWSSIGYTIGACQGAALAARDSENKTRRTILFIGDGSFQCGCQELSTIIRNNLRPIM
jgi:pyruvate decarboxylase